MTANTEIPKTSKKNSQALQGMSSMPVENEITTRLMDRQGYAAGMFAAAQLDDGEYYNCGVISVDGLRRQLVAPDGSVVSRFWNTLRACHRPPLAPLRQGDEVVVLLSLGFGTGTFFFQEEQEGGLALITGEASGGGVRHLLSPSALFVHRRTQIADLYADLNLRMPNGQASTGAVSEAAPAEAEIPSLTGWFSPHGGGITHWTQAGKVLCGRALPKDLTLINTDPDDQAIRARACVKCGKALDKLQSAAIREHLTATHRVWVTFPDGVRAQAVSPSGTPHPQTGLYSLVRELDDVEIRAAWRDLEPAPALAIGDRVSGMNDKTKVGTVIGNYADENKPLATKVRWDDGTEGGGHAANLRRVLNEVQPDAPVQNAPEAPARLAVEAAPYRVGDRVRFIFGDDLIEGKVIEIRPATPTLPVLFGIQAEGWITPVIRALVDLRPPESSALPVSETPSSTPEIETISGTSTPVFEVPVIEPFRPGIQLVAWNKLVASELNPRKHFEQASLIELAISIYRSGVKQNLQARPHPTRPGLFELAAGERRWRAIGLLVVGLEVGTGAERETLTVPSDFPVPVLTEELSDLDLIQNATAENVQRNDMTPLEVADAYAAMQERGATVDSLAARFGKTKRFIQRRIDISRNLIKDLRDLYDTGRLPLASAELLAISPKATQQAIYKDTLRHQGVQISFEQLKNRLVGHLFHVDTAKFPRSWYTGKINPGDLYGDLPAHFEDFDLAMSMQEKHAVASAKQDILDGANFADVAQRPEAMLWQYGKGNGVLYWINSKTGALKRHTGLTLLSYPAPPYRFEAPKPVPTHETPEASPTRPASADPEAASDRSVPPVAPVPAPALPAQPKYPQGLPNAYEQDLMQTALTQDRVSMALFIYTSLHEGWGMLDHPSSHEAALTAIQLTDGVLVPDQDSLLTIGKYPGQGTERYTAVEVVRALLSLPDSLLAALHRAHCLEFATDVFGVSLLSVLRALPDTPAPVMDEAFLQACNDAAIEALWDEAELGSRANTTRSYLVSILLEEAPALAAKGFLPRPWRSGA